MAIISTGIYGDGVAYLRLISIGYGSRRYRPNGQFRLQNEVDAIIEQIGDITEPFHLIGHSYGGAVATYFAKQYPERSQEPDSVRACELCNAV